MKKHEVVSSPLSAGYIRRYMRSYLSMLAVSALLLTGCSNQNPDDKTEYDPVELIEYEACFKLVLDGLLNDPIGKYFETSRQMKIASDNCEPLRPTKK